ncbi:type II CAAX prenyl endopeptidase Rce1 family protein [Granulicella sibirica]|uniref:Putative metal-dependent membrane protease n=1 Tax=Granulicella sibirica TaxID=2479048 RepID=A0A4Q0T1J3_9BACT|nr:CPBP family glutamic-type intramembrane protease [Granulicella sibirica]RXH55838.1 putative metal-dependent membrane protease [Granulicella sibirica]
MSLFITPDIASSRLRRLPQLLLFAGFAAWYYGSDALASRAANGFSVRFRLGLGEPLLEVIFHLFLLVLGFVALETIARQAVPLGVLIALPVRLTSYREWAIGAAVAWATVIVALLPLILSARLHAQIEWTGRSLIATILTLGMLWVASLAHEITFRGYPFRCLIGAVGATPAVILMMLGSGFAVWRNPYAPRAGVLAAMLMTLLLSLGWLRTRGIWLPWGLHFALTASLGVLFGLPIAGVSDLASMVRGSTLGPDWLTGGDFGPSAALFSLVVMIGAIVVLVRATRDFAWEYTHAPIVAGGYEVVVAPPAAHTAMEQATVKKAPALVQILPSAPQGISAPRPDTPAPPPPMPDRLH